MRYRGPKEVSEVMEACFGEFSVNFWEIRILEGNLYGLQKRYVTWGLSLFQGLFGGFRGVAEDF